MYTTATNNQKKMNNKKQYRTTVYCGTVNGKEITKTVRASSQRELNKKVANIKAELAAGKDVYTNALFGVWADKWLNEYKKPSGISSGTLTQYQSAINHINRYFEFVELKKIKLSDFQCAINELAENNPNTGKPMAKASLENIVKVGAAICRYARSNDIAGSPDFFKDVSIARNAPVNKRRALTELEQEYIIQCEHRAQPAAMIMLFSGLRRGELIPLQWSDIDLQNGYINVNKSVEFKSNQPTVKQGGKSANAVRNIPIPKVLIDYLIEYKASSRMISTLVCVNASGKMHTKTSFRKMWDSYLFDLNIKYGYAGLESKRNLLQYLRKVVKDDTQKKRIDKLLSCVDLTDEDIIKYIKHNAKELIPMRIEPFTPHYLRHTFATLLYLQSIDVVTAKQYLGHSDIQTTVNIYTDLENNNRFALSDTYKAKLQQGYKIASA